LTAIAERTLPCAEQLHKEEKSFSSVRYDNTGVINPDWGDVFLSCVVQ
jgi:hypothetical protein